MVDFRNEGQPQSHVIDQLLRPGEIMTILAPSRQYKSTIALNLAVAVAGGRKWLGKFQCARGRVLMIDTQHHEETISHRGRSICLALDLPADEAGKQIDYDLSRGATVGIEDVTTTLENIYEEKRSYSLCIADELSSDLDSSRMESLYGAAEDLHCAVVLVRSIERAETLYSAGYAPGSQARLTDASVVVRPHETDGIIVIDSVSRSFKPTNPFRLRVKYPAFVELVD